MNMNHELMDALAHEDWKRLQGLCMSAINLVVGINPVLMAIDKSLVNAIEVDPAGMPVEGEQSPEEYVDDLSWFASKLSKALDDGTGLLEPYYRTW